jgi:LytTr DNA-binding domain
LTLREWAATFANMLQRLAIEILIVLAIGLVLGLFGPFGTYEMPAGLRIGYWMLFGLGGYAIFRPMVVVGRWLSEALNISPLIGIGLAQLVAAAPTTLLIGWLMSGFDVMAVLRSERLGALYAQVWLIGFIVNMLVSTIFARARSSIIDPSPVTEPKLAPEARPNAPSPIPLLDRLPPGFGVPLAIKSEDHYVRIYARERDTLILLRLRDAIAELGSTQGLQVHRSWWVARDSIVSTARDGRNLTLNLANGITVPVSRDGAALLKTNAWL